ncbi:MAG: hypothetical protein HOJ35_04945 [Bdellovibrionales bacterium]|jgi:hypothetical protein|nr:hypothetical protein [Bdellovibrionales bacterium]
MTKTIIIQTGVEIDIINTLHACRSLSSIPNHGFEIVYLSFCNPSLKAELHDIFDVCHELNPEELSSLFSSKGKDKSLSVLKDFINNLNDRRNDKLINLSNDHLSFHLAGLIKAGSKKGSYFNQKMNLMIEDSWSQVFYARNKNKEYNCLHAVDFYKNILQVNHYNSLENITDKPLRKILIAPQANKGKQQLTVSIWREIIQGILTNIKHCEIIILPDLQGQKFVSEILDYPYNNKTNSILPVLINSKKIQLNKLFCDVDLIISHNNNISHFASVKNISTILLSYPTDEIPYSNQCLMISPKTPINVDDINSQSVLKAIKCFSFTGLEYEIPGQSLSRENIYFPIFTNLSYLKLINATHDRYINDINTAWSTLYRIIWLYIIDSSEEKLSVQSFSEDVQQNFKDGIQGIELLHELFEFGKTYSKEIINLFQDSNSNMTSISLLSKKIDEIEILMDNLRGKYNFLSPVVDYYNANKTKLNNKNLTSMMQINYLNFEDVSLITSSLFDLIQQSISETCPNTEQQTGSM